MGPSLLERSWQPVVAWAGEVGFVGGSWVAISGVVSPPIWVISVVTLLMTPLITTHEPPK